MVGLIARFDPAGQGPGDSGLGTIREIAGWFVMTALVLAVIALVVSIVLWLMGRLGHASHHQVQALTVFTRVLIGASALGSVGGLVWWGSGIGGGMGSLMPAVAARPTIDITRNPPKSTCTNTVMAMKPSERLWFSDEDRNRLADALLQPNDAATVKGQNIARFSWTPTGPDCTSNNIDPAACPEVKVLVVHDALGGERQYSTENSYKSRNFPRCTSK